MVHEAQLDTTADSAVCPSRRLVVIAKSFHAVALKNAGRSIAIPILQVFQDDRAANILHFQRVRMLVTFRSEQQRRVIPTRHYPQSYHDLLFVRWQGGGISVEEQSP